MKYNNYEISYNNNGEITSEYMPTKMELVKRYIQILQDTTFNVSCLKAFKNDRDITAKINEFLNK